MKQFENYEEFKAYEHNYNNTYCSHDAFGIMPDNGGDSFEEFAKQLVRDGYDLDNLFSDEHPYEICGHTNIRNRLMRLDLEVKQ